MSFSEIGSGIGRIASASTGCDSTRIATVQTDDAGLLLTAVEESLWAARKATIASLKTSTDIVGDDRVDGAHSDDEDGDRDDRFVAESMHFVELYALISPSTSELRPIYGIWLQFNALPSDTATATLVATLPLAAPDEPDVEPLSVHWEENTTWASSNLPRSQFARPLGELRFDAATRSANLSLGAVLPVLRRAFTLRVELSPNAFFAADQFLVASFALVVDSAPSAVAALAATCAGGAPTSSCDACLARGGELCGFCADTASCQLGWRDGPIATTCSRTWQYAACPSADRAVLAPVEECTTGATYRYRFALPATVGTRGLASASLQLASLASPFVVDPQVVFTTFDVAYVRSTAAVGSLEQPLCDLVLDAADRRNLGTLAHAQRFVGDVADGVRHLAMLGERTLIVEASATSDDNVFEIVGGGDVSHTRDTPRLTLNWLAGDAPEPPSSACAAATACAACTELPFCGWCGNRCVQGDLNAPSNATCAAYSFDARLCSASERLTLSASVAPAATCVASTSLGETRRVDSDLERFVQLSYDFKSIVLSFDLRPVRAAMLANRSRLATGSVQLRARYRETELPTEPVYADLTWLVGASALCSNASSAAAYSAVVGAPAAVRLAANASVQPRDVPLTTLPIAADALASALYADTLQVRLTFVDAAVRVWSPVVINVNERLAPTLVVEFAAAAPQPDPCATLATRAACLTAPSCGWCARVASRGGAAGCISGSPLTPHNTSECAPTNYAFAEPATVGAAGVTVEMRVVDDVADWGNPWPNMPSLASSAVEAVVRVPASLASRRVARATLAFRFVRGALREGNVEYADESVAAAMRNDSVTATVRFDRAARFDAPLAVTMLGANDGFTVDVTDALRVAAESAARLLVVRVGGNVSQSALDVRVFTSFDPNPRRAAALSVVTVADATEAANAACVVHTTCGACAAVESCGWCVGASDAGACLAGSPQQPLFGRTCAAWSYSACLPSDMVALFTPLACSNVGRIVDDRAPIAALYEPQETPRAATQPRSQLQMTHVQVVTIDLTALRVGGRGALSVQAPIRLRLFAAQHADLSALPPTDMVAWILPSTDSLNVSAADCAALGPLAFDSGAAVARTRLASQIHAGDAIDLDVSAAFANATTTDQLVRIMFSTQATALAVVAPGNCARPRFRPMLVTRTPQLTRGGVALRRTIADDCPFDGGLYSDAAALPDAPLGRRDIAVGAAQQWRAGDASASAAQALGDVSDALRDTLPRVVDITSLAFVGANATLVAFVSAPTLGRFDLVRVSDSLNVSTPIRLVLVVDADSTPTGNATVTLVRAASLRGSAPTVVVDSLVVGLDAQCVDVAATAQVNANATLSARLAVERFPRARVADMQRVSVRDSGGEFVVLRGVGFVAPAADPRPRAVGGAVKCLFESGESFVADATVLNDTAISCGPLPPIDIGLVRSGTIALSWDGGICATASMAAFDVASDCTNVCSGHGQCRLQECVCVDPFRGDNCERVVSRLVVAPVPNATIDDGQTYSAQLNVVNGSAPITSLPLVLPDGAAWNAQNRTLVWPRAVGRMRPYEFVVRVSNELDSVTLSWFVTVRRTIAVGINVTQAERQRLPLAVGERLDLRVQTTPVTAGVVASIVAQSNDSDAWYELGSGAHGAVVPFQPTAAQVGVTVFAATRTGDDADDVPLAERLSVEVVHLQFGATALPEIALAAGQKRTLTNFVTLTNPSKRALTEVVVVVSAQHAAATTPVLRIGTLAAGASQAVSFELAPSAVNGSVTIDSVVLAARSAERASALVTVPARIVARLGALVLVDERALKASVPFDEPRLVTFAVRNAAPIVARDVTVELGAAASLFSVVAGRYTSDLDVNGTLTVTLRVLVASPPTTTRTLTGALSVRADEGAFVSVPYEITAVASPFGTLRVVPEDQATYYGGGVLVPGASARLFDSDGVLVRAFNASQSAVAPELLAENVTEGSYELRVEAPGRAPARELITVQRGVVNRVAVFLMRSVVSYVWRVVPTGYNDDYTFVLDMTFETSVPAPVLSVAPNTLKVEQWCEAAVLAASRGDTFVVNFNVTNTGLIRADNVELAFPADSSLVTFEKLVDIPASIEARQSAIVPVAVRARPDVATCKYSRDTAPATRKRQATWYDCDVAVVVWTIECGGVLPSIVAIPVDVNDFLPPCLGGSAPPFAWSAMAGRVEGHSPFVGTVGGGSSLCQGNRSSDDCASALIDLGFECASNFAPVAAVKWFRDIYGWVATNNVSAAGHSIAKMVIGIVVEVAGDVFSIVDCLGKVRGLQKCSGDDLLELLNTRKRSDDQVARAKMLANLLAINEMHAGIDALLGGSDFFEVAVRAGATDNAEVAWLESLSTALAATRPQPPLLPGVTLDDVLVSMFGASTLAALRGRGYTATRRTVLESMAMAVAFPRATVLPSGFDPASNIDLAALNRRADVTLRAFDRAEADGFTSPYSALAAYRGEVLQFEARARVGVCAVVKVRIEQRVSLTRTVFEASLVIDNSALEALSGVAVELAVLDAARRPVALAVFNVTRRAAPLLDSANATLAPGSQAELVWLLAPQDSAAPRDPTTYFVGGALRYRIGADPATSIELLPERIVVYPNPRLRFDYFLERRVLSDDPFTDDVVEPSVPFALGVLVSNDGYGVAQNMTVSSSQPKIVENSRGLLIDFAIVSARANDAPVQASLLVALGDIGAQSSASALWSLTASLQGEFTEFNASFRHQSPVGDGPQLTSIVQSVKTHRLTRAVTLPSTGRVAFLADDVLEVGALADTLYSGRLSEAVARMQLTDEAAVAPLYNAATQTLTLTSIAAALMATQPSARFFYVRLVDPLGSNSTLAVVGAASVPGNVSAVDAWRERYTERLVNQAPRDVRWLHLFANASDGFVWRLRTVVLPGALTVRVVNATSSSGVAVWENGGDAPVDVEYRRVGASNATLVAAAAWRGAARFVLGDLAPDTEYEVIVTPVRDSAARGTPAKARFHTLSIDAARSMCAAATSDAATCNATIAVSVAPVTCASAGVCENGGQLGANCTCVCRDQFSGARCHLCETATLQCANGVAGVLDGKCACACAAGWSGARCDQMVLRSTDSCASAQLLTLAHVTLCFEFPRPAAVRIVATPQQIDEGVVVGFNTSTELPSVLATITVSGLAATDRHALLVWNGSTWVNASTTCQPSATTAVSAGGVLRQSVCTLGAFRVIDGSGPSSTTTTTVTTVLTSDTNASATATTTSNATASQMSLDATAPEPSSSRAGLIGGLIAGFLALSAIAVIGGMYWRQRKQAKKKEEEAESFDAELQQRPSQINNGE